MSLFVKKLCFLSLETVTNQFLVKITSRTQKKEKEVATPYLHNASVIRRPRPDALNVILRLTRCLDGMR